jgi:two-component system OmpR family sensor kinase
VDLLRKEPVALDPLLQSLAAQGPHLGERDWRVEALPGGRVFADQDRLTQVFLNLMQNAVSHTSPGQVIALGGAREKEGVQLWVRDEGEGMTEAVRARVFERRYRDPEGATGTPGLGLGLAIVRAIVTAHGGTVRAESASGNGSRFTVRLRTA